MNPTPGFRKFLIVLASVVCVVYLAYRAFFTFNTSTPYAYFASLFLYVGEAFGIMNLLLYFLQVWEVDELPPQPVLEGRTVDVFVPTYNEDPQLLRATLEACVRMEYAHRTFLCDDGGTEARLNDPQTGQAARERAEVLKEMCADLGVIYLTRPDNRNAKAGNINAAFEQTDGEFIVVLDADHVPEPHFITRLIGYFHDDRLGYVQTPHAFYNFDSFQARLNPQSRRYWEEGHLFYCVIQPGRNRWNAPIFAGSAAMFRRSALRDVGYYAVETITEDMHTGLRMNAKGWKSTAITERLVAGQAAPDITTFHSQRLRWGEGNVSTMFYDNPLTMRGLTLGQRLCYFASMIHWAGGVFKLAIYLTPILMLFTGVPPVRDFTVTLGVVTGTYLLISLMALKIVSNGYGAIINSELFAMVNFWTQCKATYRALFRRRNQRFIVTAKRGRQGKHIWPFIRPQTYLIILSVLALVWGWGRVILGISDDWYKPIIPTLWVIFHICLAYLAVRRAFWPVNRRFSIRHEVNLPVEYEPVAAEASNLRYGITADLNETGMAFICYEELEVGSVMRFTMRGAAEVVRCKGEIRGKQKLSDQRMVHGYRYGVLFLNLTPPQIDALNRICLHYAVPRLYEQYTRGNRDNFIRRIVNWSNRGGVQRRIAERYPYHLPLMLNPGTSEETAAYTATEDLSRVATAALVDYEMPPGTKVEYVMPTPLGEIRGQATVLRSDRRQYAGQAYYRSILTFDEFHGQGRNTVQSLVNPDYAEIMDPVLRPSQKPPLVRMGVPILVACLIILPLVFAMRYFAFPFVHEDDFFLKSIAVQQEDLSPEQQTRVDQIFERTIHERYPSNDRLVLLMDVMKKRNQTPELDQVTKLLGARDPNNWKLREAYAQALDNTRDYVEAEIEYKRLLALSDSGNYSQEEKKNLYFAAARMSVHAGKYDDAIARYKKILEIDPLDKQARYELAGAYVSGGQFDNAERLYRDFAPDREARKLLVAIYINKQPPRYDLAAREAEEIRKLGGPGDDTEGLKLKADIAAAQKDFQQARNILETLLRSSPADPEIRLKLAQQTLANRRWLEALKRFEELLVQGNARPEVVRGFVDAAASAPVLTDQQREQTIQIYKEVMETPQENAIFLARLSWVLQKESELEKSRDVMKKAIAVDPQDPTNRQQFAGLLVSMGEYEEALSFINDDNSPFAKGLQVNIHIQKKEYPQAVTAARALVDLQPNDIKNHLLLVDTLALNNQFDEAIAYLTRLQKSTVNPDDQDQIAVKIAGILLWDRKFAAAAGRYYDLIEPKFEERRKLWDDYINALSSVEDHALQPKWVDLAVKIANEKAAATNKDALPLSRLAWVLLRANRIEAAKPLLDQAVALNPKDEGVRRELAGVLARAERYDEAIKMYAGLKLTEEDRMNLALIHAGAKNWTAAEQEVNALLASAPKDAKVERKAKYLLADIASWRQDFATAVRMFEELEKEYPADETLPVRVAEITLWAKDYEKALTRFQELYEKQPNSPKVWEGFAKSAAQAKSITPENITTARAILDKVAESDTKDPILLVSVSWLADRIQQPARAEAFVVRALENRPSEPPARREMANILYRTHRNREALSLLEGIPLLRDDRFLIIAAAGEVKNGDLVIQQAEILMKEPGKEKDRRARAAYAFGLSLKGRNQEALKIYEELLAEAKDDKELFRQVADALLTVGNYQEAMQKFSLLINEKTEDMQLFVRFIDAAASADKLTDTQKRLALLVYDRVAASTLQDAVRLSRLAWIMFDKLRDRKRAEVMIDRALAAKPTDPEARMEIAGVLSSLDRHREALAMFEGIPPQFVNRLFYVEVLSSARDFARAEVELRALLKDKPDDKDLLFRFASVLTWGSKFDESTPLWASLEQKYPKDRQIQTMAAFNSLWAKKFLASLNRFDALLRQYPEDPEIQRGYVDSVAGVDPTDLREPIRQKIVPIYDAVMAEGVRSQRDAQFLASVGSALARFQDRERARAAFMKALTTYPQNRTLWRRFGEALYNMRYFDDAERIFAALVSGDVPRLAAYMPR